jgi:hypothetical protein
MDAAVIRQEAQVLRPVGAPRDLGQRAAAEVAQEHVAVAHEGRTGPRTIEHGLRAIEGLERRIKHRPHPSVAQGVFIQVAHRAGLALELEQHTAAVQHPAGIFHRGADPVRVGHDLFKADIRVADRGGFVGGPRDRCAGKHGQQGWQETHAKRHADSSTRPE